MKNIFKPRLMLLLFLTLFYPTFAMALDVNLAWEPNTEENVAGYRVYAREAGEAYNYNTPEWEGADAQCTVKGFDQYASYYFVVRAFDSKGNESGDSNEVYLAAADPPSNGNSNTSLESGGGASDGGGGGGGGCFIGTLFGE